MSTATIFCIDGSCGNARLGVYSADQCRVCWLRARAGTTPRARTARAKKQPNTYLCPHRDDTGPAIARAACAEGCDKGQLLPVRACALHERCTVAKHGEGVAYCCRDCPDRPREAAQPRTLIVPQPPPLDLHPRSRRAVVTVVVGTEAQAMHAAARRHLEAYARRLGADLVVLDWPGHPDWPMSSKFAIGRVLDHYERVCYLDADTLCRPNCVDLFALCDDDEWGWVDELPWHRTMSKFGREKAYLAFRREMGFKDVPHLPWMCNAGVLVVPARYRDLLLPPTEPIKPGHCAEQDLVNARVLDGFLDGRVKVRLLDRRSNHQSWTDWGFKAATSDALLHWSGAGKDRKTRPAQIAEWAARHPVLPLPLETWAEVFESFRGRRVALVRMPNGNVGDVMLEVAALKLFEHFGATARLVTDPAAETDPDEPLCVAAGGNMGGHLNQAAAEARSRLGETVTVLPQTWERPEVVPASWTLWVRERTSLEHEPRARLAPDLALCLEPADLGVDVLPEGQGLGVWLRRDGEALWADRPATTDPATVCATPGEYLELAARYAEIVTDRLHFAIAGMIAGRRVTLVAGAYHKNRSVWEHSLQALGCGWADDPAQ